MSHRSVHIQKDIFRSFILLYYYSHHITYVYVFICGFQKPSFGPKSTLTFPRISRPNKKQIGWWLLEQISQEDFIGKKKYFKILHFFRGNFSHATCPRLKRQLSLWLFLAVRVARCTDGQCCAGDGWRVCEPWARTKSAILGITQQLVTDACRVIKLAVIRLYIHGFHHMTSPLDAE